MGTSKIILIACGSFNPPTSMHLRMFEIARDSIHHMGQHWVVGGVISPVHDAYGKKDLVACHHRCEMLRLALRSSDWIQISEWETNQEGWSRTIQVLQHHQNALNSYLCLNNNRDQPHDQIDGVSHFNWIPEDIRKTDGPVTMKLLCGADLLESFSTPGLWKDSDIETIVGQHGLVVVTREGSNPLKFIYESDLLTRYQRNIIIVNEWINNDISSTKIRRALRRQESVRYLIDDNVIDYIAKHHLYGYQNNAFKYRDTIKDNLNIPINNFILTPSPSDVNMRSVSPSKAEQDISLTLQPLSSIDQPDTGYYDDEEPFYSSKREIKFKNDTEVVKYPGKAVKIVPVESTPGKTKKVGFVDDSENPKKVVTTIKQAPELQKVVLDSGSEKCEKVIKKPPRLSDPTRSRNVFKRSNSDIPTSHSNPDLEVTPVKIEFTKEGVKVISDKESMV